MVSPSGLINCISKCTVYPFFLSMLLYLVFALGVYGVCRAFSGGIGCWQTLFPGRSCVKTRMLLLACLSLSEASLRARNSSEERREA